MAKQSVFLVSLESGDQLVLSLSNSLQITQLLSPEDRPLLGLHAEAVPLLRQTDCQLSQQCFSEAASILLGLLATLWQFPWHRDAHRCNSHLQVSDGSLRCWWNDLNVDTLYNTGVFLSFLGGSKLLVECKIPPGAGLPAVMVRQEDSTLYRTSVGARPTRWPKMGQD